MKRTLQVILLVPTLCVSLATHAANRYWIAATTGNWSNTANWSNVSGGSGGFSAPAAGDQANFDGNGLANCNLDIPVSIATLNVAVPYSGTITQTTNSFTTTGNTSLLSGNFAGGTANITFAGTFTMSGTAVFTSTSATLEFQNNATFTSGTFNHNNGTVRYNRAANLTIAGIAQSYFNLEMVGTGFSITISSAALTVANTFTISGSAFLNINTGTINANGDISITNTATGGGGSGLINISGTVIQNFNGAPAAGQGSLPQLTINKPSGALNLNNFPSIANSLTYTAGIVNAAGSTFCFTRATTGAYTVTGSMTLNNILFTANAALTLTIASGTTLTANGTMTMAGTANLTFNTGTINLLGNLILTNTGTAGGGSATINIGGSTTQNIDGSAISANQNLLPLVTINSTGTIALIGNISFSRNVSYIAGTMNPGTSTVYITNSLTMSGSFSLYNLTLNRLNNMTLTLAAGNTVTITNNLDFENGAFNITVNTGTLAVQGNFINNNAGTAGGGTAVILFNGNASQTISSTGTIYQGSLPAVTINKTSGTLLFPSLITVRGNWTYTAGVLDVTTSNSTIVFAATMTITGTHNLNNADFDAAGNYTYTIAAGSTLTLNGNMTMSNANNITLNTGNINLNGNLNLTNTGLAGGGTTVIGFTGSGNQAINGTLLINQCRLPSITIAKSGGTLTFNPLITVRGNWTYTSGILDVTTNNSTVIFENNMTITGSHALNNVDFEAAGNYTYTFGAGTVLTMNGSMSMTNSNSIIFTAGAINLNGDLNLSNTGTAGGGTTVLSFTGSGNQSILGSRLIDESRLPAVTINKSGGILTFNTLITVRGNWTYTSGTIDVTTNNSTVIFRNSLTITGSHTLRNINFAANGAYIYTVSTGTVLTVTGTLNVSGTSTVTLNTPVAGSTAIQAQGDMAITNSAAGGGGTGLILINGPGAQMLSSTAASGQGRMPYVTVQKPSGTLTLSGIISVSRDWTYNTGTVDAGTNSSSVVFGGNNLNVTSAGMSFYHFVVTANTTTLANGLAVDGDLTINGTGILAPAANTITLKGNWIDRGTAGFTEATSAVQFIGNSLQSITSPGGENFANLTINNPGAGIQLINNTIVSTNLNMNLGNIDLNGNAITLGISVVNKGVLTHSTGTMINTGTFTRWFSTVTIPDGSVNGLFPTGTSTDYRPFYVSAPVTGPTTGGTISVGYNDATTNTNVNIADGLFTIFVRKDLNWNVSTANGFAGGNVNLRVEGTGFGPISAPSDLRLSLVNSVVGTAGVNAGTNGNPQINRTGLTGLNLSNTFYVGSINVAILPIKLISFTARLENGEVNLNWSTATESNNDYYVVQRSGDAANWEDVQKVKGSGNSNTQSNYSVIDAHPLSGISYYRIVQTDFDGQQWFSMVKDVNANESASLTIYPNPASNYIHIVTTGSRQVFVTLYNSNGQRIYAPASYENGNANINVSSLSAGTYFVQIKQGNSMETRTINIVR